MGTIKGVNTVADLKAWLPNAEIPQEPAEPEAKAAKLVEPGILVWDKGAVMIIVAIQTPSLTNLREHWSAKSKRTQTARKAVREAIGPHLGLLEPFCKAYAEGKALKVTFTRIGGRKLDRMANLGPSLKAVEDALAYLLGVDDGSPLWHAVAEQEPGPSPAGVRITIEEFPT